MTTDHDVALPRAARPPAWAEALLRLLLEPADRESVSGDLLEEYREAIVPARGPRAADRWYILQAGGFLWRATWIWALLFSGAFLARTAYDWLVPTTDFLLRSEVSTAFGVATLSSTAGWAAWRSGSFVAGIFVAVVTSQVAAVISVIGASLMLAIWHDPYTQRAIIGSGGLGEVYVLPFMMVIPAVIVGSVGGAAGSLWPRGGIDTRRVFAASISKILFTASKQHISGEFLSRSHAGAPSLGAIVRPALGAQVDHRSLRRGSDMNTHSVVR